MREPQLAGSFSRIALRDLGPIRRTQGVVPFGLRYYLRSMPKRTFDAATLRMGERVSRTDTEELGTVVGANGKIKVKWDGGKTSYFRRDQRANVRRQEPSLNGQG
jgi:hypothetical protein